MKKGVDVIIPNRISFTSNHSRNNERKHRVGVEVRRRASDGSAGATTKPERQLSHNPRRNIHRCQLLKQ
jgi:hypothetical protein